MYFPIEINEQLANAMRAAAEAKTEIRLFRQQEESISIKRVDMPSIDDIDEALCEVICKIANLAGRIISANVVDKSEKDINKIINQIKIDEQ